MPDLIDNMLAAQQLTPADAEQLRELTASDDQWHDVGEESVLRWLGQQYSVPFSDLTDIRADAALVAQFPARILLKHELLPLRRVNGAIDVATSRLFDTRGIDILKVLTGENISSVLTPSHALRRAMKEWLGVGADTLDAMAQQAQLQVVDDRQYGVDLDDNPQDAAIIGFVNRILADAIEQRATDIHLEPFSDELCVRYRIDGVLQDVPVPADLRRFQPSIVSRVKIMSDLDIAEKLVPQDGSIKLRTAVGEVDVRVSVIPMIYGEAVVMRLLRQDNTLRGLDELHMGPREQGLLRRVLSLPHGIVLVTGPTGSGKTTTLYAALQEINDAERKIITIEDPVEYKVKGVNQIQVSERTGLTFSRGLRSILRHDPDIILVGEIRDTETARIAVQASLTGHLVFSTLHTNDSPGALTRLVDMGVEPYLVASSVEAILAQRLVRVLCGDCKEEDVSDTAPASRRLAAAPPGAPVYQAVGCEMCRQMGFQGRRAVFEALQMTDVVRGLVLRSASSAEIRDAARRDGWHSLAEDGWRIVREGETTVAEVLRVTKDESDIAPAVDDER